MKNKVKRQNVKFKMPARLPVRQAGKSNVGGANLAAWFHPRAFAGWQDF